MSNHTATIQEKREVIPCERWHDNQGKVGYLSDTCQRGSFTRPAQASFCCGFAHLVH